MNVETGRVALMLAAFVALMASRCKPNTPPAPPDVVIVDAGDGGGPDDCTAACVRLASLGCPEARPTDAGETCGEVCRRIQGETPRVFDLHPACVADAGSVEEVRRCGVRCKP